MTEPHRPKVVIVRPTDVETDSRAKKMAISLDRMGYDVLLLGRSGTGKRREGRIGGAHVTLVVPRSRLRGTPQRLMRLPSRVGIFGRSIGLKSVEATTNAMLQLAERNVDTRLRQVEKKGAYLFTAAQRDFRTTYGSELVKAEPEIIHVHDPRLLPVAFAAADRITSRTKRSCAVIYDARENFAGVLETNDALPEYHKRVLRAETTFGPRTAAILTVSDAVADAITHRIKPETAPTVLLNTPVLRDHGGVTSVGRTLREDAAIPADAKVLVYPGAASKARGVDTIIEALPHLPGWHAVLVVVPHPHPRAEELMGIAADLGVADRLHLVAPVPADDVPAYLSTADVAVHPMTAGIPNHEMAMPNKLFEIMHARVPMASSSVRTMSAFVRAHHMGGVFTSGNAAELARLVLELDAETQAGTPRLASQADIERYSWQGQEDRLAAAYRRAAEPGPGHRDEPFAPVLVDWD